MATNTRISLLTLYSYILYAGLSGAPELTNSIIFKQSARINKFNRLYKDLILEI